MLKLRINEIYDVSKYYAPVIYYHVYNNSHGWDANVPVLVGSNDKKQWKKIFVPPANPINTPTTAYLLVQSTTTIPLYRHKYKYVKLVWGCHTWGGIGEPVGFHFGREGWRARNPENFYAYMFDFVYSPKYALNLANYVLTHRKSQLTWNSPVNPRVTLKSNRVTKVGYISNWNIYSNAEKNPSHLQCVGEYDEICIPTIKPCILPPGTYKTTNNKPTKIVYLDLIPNWQYQHEPIHTLHTNTITVYNFIALIEPTYLFPTKIFTPNNNLKIYEGYVESKISLLGKINDKNVWISNKTKLSGKLTIDRWAFNVPPKPHVISNLRKNNDYVFFDSSYDGKVRITFNNKTITYPVHEGTNKISLKEIKNALSILSSGKLCIEPL